MPAGVPTEESVLAEFRAEYLYSGNASAVGRKLGLDERTARKIASRLEDDPSFAEEGRKLRDRALNRLVAMRLRVAEKASERFEDDTGGIDVKEYGGEGGNVVITDKRWEYGKLVLDAEKNAANLARFDADQAKEPSVPTASVTITFSPTPEAAARLVDDTEPKP